MRAEGGYKTYPERVKKERVANSIQRLKAAIAETLSSLDERLIHGPMRSAERLTNGTRERIARRAHALDLRNFSGHFNAKMKAIFDATQHASVALKNVWHAGGRRALAHRARGFATEFHTSALAARKRQATLDLALRAVQTMRTKE